MNRTWILAVVPILLAACVPEQASEEPSALSAAPLAASPSSSDLTPIDQADPQELLDELLAMAEEPKKFELTPRPYEICDRLINEGPTTLAPFVALLDAEETLGETRLFVLQCVVGIMREDYLPQLEAMLSSEDWSTRSCAITIIGSIRSEKSIEILKKLREDEDERISFAALSGLALQVGDPYRSELTDLYFQEDTSNAWKTEIVRVVMMNPGPSDRQVLEGVLLDETTSNQGRDMATMMLANFGSPESLPALEKSLELDSRESFQNMTKSAIAFIQEQNKAQAEPADAPEEQ